MATVVTYYVNTASSGGDGTTNGTSGANAAFASLADFIAGITNKNLVSQDIQIDCLCSGVAADTTQVNAGTWTCDDTRFLHIQANTGDPAGQFTGPESWSDSHYRLEVSVSSFVLKFFANNFLRVTGIQIHNPQGGGGSSGLDFDGLADATFDGLRIRGGFSSGVGVDHSTRNTTTRNSFKNCQVYGWGTGMFFNNNVASVNNADIANNTIMDNTIQGLQVRALSNNQFGIRNNVFYSNAEDYTDSGSSSTLDTNAGQDSTITSTTNAITLSANLDDDMVDPTNATVTARDCTAVASGILDDAGIGNSTVSGIPTEDIKRISRSLTTPDLGSLENAGATPPYDGPNFPDATVVAQYRADRYDEDTGEWLDTGGNEYHLGQATASSRPLQEVGGPDFNDQDVVRADGVDDYLTTSTSPNIPLPVTTICIYKHTVASALANAAFGTKTRVSSAFFSGENQTDFHRVVNSHQMDSTTSTFNQATLFEDYVSETNSYTRVNGVEDATDTGATQPYNGFTLFARDDISNYWGGDAVEFIVVAGELTDADREALGSYVASRYGFDNPYPSGTVAFLWANQ